MRIGSRTGGSWPVRAAPSFLAATTSRRSGCQRSLRNSYASLRAWEAFKVYGGQIHAVEAFMKAMPPPGLAAATAEQVVPKQAGYVAPTTPWGDPDLNGVWPDI